jgi:hypothetical protein
VRRAALLGVCVLGLGCAEEAAVLEPPGGGQVNQAPDACVDGPFGWSEGSTLQNVVFEGFARPEIDATTSGPISLCDFHNPTGASVYPEASPYGAGNPKPRGLLLHVAGIWDSPGSYEAKNVLPAKYAAYEPLGGEFLLLLQDGQQPGESAGTEQLQNWIAKFEVNYPSVIDPARRLEPYYALSALPQNLLVDTRTMEIVKVLTGLPDPGFWDLLADLAMP